jgi:hypothetical protein
VVTPLVNARRRPPRSRAIVQPKRRAGVVSKGCARRTPQIRGVRSGGFPSAAGIGARVANRVVVTFTRSYACGCDNHAVAAGFLSASRRVSVSLKCRLPATPPGGVCPSPDAAGY